MKERNKTKKIVTLGMLCALSVVLMMLIRFPIFPSAPFLEYEPMDIPLLIAGLHFGPLAGIAVVVISSLIQAVTVSSGSGIIGAIMHIIQSGALILVASIVYNKNKTKKVATLALILGTLSMALMAIPTNLIFTTRFMGAPVEVVKAMMLPTIIPFNLIKAGVNSIFAFFVYKPISNYLYKAEEPDPKVREEQL